MAQFSDLPTEVVDMVFAEVKDSAKLFPLLLKRQTHGSANIAMYAYVKLNVSRSDALIRAAALPWVAALLGRAKMLNLYPPDAKAKIARDRIDMLLDFMPGLVHLILGTIPLYYNLRSNLPCLRKLQIGVHRSDAGFRWATSPLRLSLSSNLQALAIHGDLPVLLNSACVHTLTKLDLRVLRIRVGGIAYELYGPGLKPLPFTQLRELSLR
jgi:hypothetical protein